MATSKDMKPPDKLLAKAIKFAQTRGIVKVRCYTCLGKGDARLRDKKEVRGPFKPCKVCEGYGVGFLVGPQMQFGPTLLLEREGLPFVMK